MSRASSFCGVILAAGESSRMGQEKALLPWPPGEAAEGNLLSAAIGLLQEHSQLVLVVAGHNADTLGPVVYSRGASMVVNRNPERGQFSSLQVGLQEVLNRGRDAAIIALVDRPPAAFSTLERLLEAFDENRSRGKWAVVPEHAGRHGHPILVGREMIESFLKAPAGSTARDVEHSLQERILYLPVDDPMVTANVNTPEDYEQLLLHGRNPTSC